MKLLNNLFQVGVYSPAFNKSLNVALPCGNIYQSNGLRKHIQHRHPDCIKYLSSIPDIINHPDYVGTNPREPNSIELVKKYDSHVLIGIKLDLDEDYLYVASLYKINDTKVKRRLHSGRLKPFQKY